MNTEAKQDFIRRKARQNQADPEGAKILWSRHGIAELVTEGWVEIRPHAFYEKGGVKSVFYHEVAHSKFPYWPKPSETDVDWKAVELVELIYGHSDDIILPFVG